MVGEERRRGEEEGEGDARGKRMEKEELRGKRKKGGVMREEEGIDRKMETEIVDAYMKKPQPRNHTT